MADAQIAEAMQVEEVESSLSEDILRLTTDEINSRARLLDNEMQSMKGELNRLKFQSKDLSEKIKENNDKIKLNKQLPYLVGNVVEVYPNNIVHSTMRFDLKMNLSWRQMSSLLSVILNLIRFWS
jgi:ATP-dependent 26S proteasome regulatory subunit